MFPFEYPGWHCLEKSCSINYGDVIYDDISSAISSPFLFQVTIRSSILCFEEIKRVYVDVIAKVSCEGPL